MQFLVVAVFVAIINECDASKAIFKRVINGVPLNGRPSTYKAIRYYGTIAYSHSFIWNYIARWDFVKPTATYCSGALLTPGIVQTACHCMAFFDEADDRYLKPPLVQHHWEGSSVIYFGISDTSSFKTYRYVTIEKFLVHSKCAKFGKVDAASYDYGIALINATWIKADDVPPTFPWIEMEWTPHYTAAVIRQFHDAAQAKQLVCLAVGFGIYERDEDYPSDVLRVGWSTLMSSVHCFYRTKFLLNTAIPPLQINQRFNWVCSHAFPKHDQEVGEGDSGGPFTCDNRHIALVSGYTFSTINKKKVRITNKLDAIAHTLYTNAIDFRNFFIHNADEVEIYHPRRRFSVDDGVDRIIRLPYQ